MKPLRTLLFLFLIALGFVGGYGWGRWYGKSASADLPPKGGRRILYYIDPMHPAYKSDKPGTAPDCGMKLEPVYADEGAAGATAGPASRKILHYRDPQDPKYTSDKPGVNPETGNELEPVYGADASSMPMGTIRVSPQKQQLIGVTYGTVEFSPGSRSIRAVGKVSYDETRIARVHAKIEGWIDKVFVDFTGKLVEKGQPLLTLYSPEMLATQQEFLLAMKGKELLKNSALSEVFEQGDSLVQAARKRLELWDLSDSQIEEIARTQKPIKNITLESPISGYVVARNAFPRQRIMPETELYTVVDLSRVWIMADVFEYEAPVIRMGQAAHVTLSYYPGKSLHARVNYIQPQVDPMTRTLKVRLEADNPENLLKPDMFVNAEFRVELPAQLTVPSNAVLDAGERKTVFVDRGNGYIEPRQVEIGERLDDRVEILKGLRAGERIVTSGNFLIDSESQLKSAAAGMAGMGHGGSMSGKPKEAAPGGAGEHAGHGMPASSQPQQPSPKKSGVHQHD
ncbi:MAG: efflux RND transporter periplasmic adaptor subunit [Acidobacteria bacterium]|nr:efflux RND transporter periplasmic adaptor subunit [Acidobacteriota bacterium]